MYKDALHVTFIFYVTYQYNHMMNVLSLLGLERLELRHLKFNLSYLKLFMVLLCVIYMIVYNLLKLILHIIREGIVIN